MGSRVANYDRMWHFYLMVSAMSRDGMSACHLLACGIPDAMMEGLLATEVRCRDADLLAEKPELAAQGALRGSDGRGLARQRLPPVEDRRSAKMIAIWYTRPSRTESHVK
jgi:hypothetical protein